MSEQAQGHGDIPKQVIMTSNNDEDDSPQQSALASNRGYASLRDAKKIIVPGFPRPLFSPDDFKNIPLQGPYPSENKIRERKAEFDKIGVDIIVIANQMVYSQEFSEQVLKGLSLYYDADSTFKKILGGRKFNNVCLLHPSLLVKMLVGKLPKTLGGKDINERAGTLGGELVVTQWGVFWEFRETMTFQHSPIDAMITACKEARGH